MKIKKILVAVDGSVNALARLESALNMANYYEASVTALYVMHIQVPGITAGGAHGGWYMGDQLLAQAREEAFEAANEVKEATLRVASQRESSIVWMQKEGEPAFVTNLEARFHDILLLGRPNAVNEPQVHAGEINSILLGCGKPCLVVPGAKPLMDLPPGNIVLAWDGSREASHALSLSMYFLTNAERVMVVSVHKHKENLQAVSQSNQRITEYLKDHGVPAHSHLLDRKKHSTAHALQLYAVDSESDMLVMGAYGHSRFREIVLGGATRTMLSEAAIPVLYAH